MTAEQTQHDRDSVELRRLAQEVHDLKRWKSTNAPRLAMLQEWKATDDHITAKAIEAGATLQSERDANAILTYELDALKLAHIKLTAERDQLTGRLVQQEPTGWIPTSGQLPPIQTRVLCMDDREHCEVDMWWGPDFSFGWPYWQKLPAAPKGEKP